MTSSPIRFEFIPSSPNTNTTNFSFSQSTLICSIPSVGNVGQLAADYLITNMPVCRRIGYISCPLILPVIGNDPFSHSHHQEDREEPIIGQLHLSAEVYHLKQFSTETGNENDKNKSYFLIQIRSPIMQHARFAQLFMRWVRDQQFSRCLILASANASWRMDSLLLETISTEQSNNHSDNGEREEVLVGTTSSHLLQRARINIRYKMTSSSTNLSDNGHDDEKSGASSSSGSSGGSSANKNAWEDSSLVKVVPPMNHSMSTSTSSITSGENDANDNDHVEVGVVHSEEEQKFLTGLRRELIEQAQEHGVHACMLLVLCNEGDNIPHGVFLAEVVALHVLFAGDVHPMRQIKW